jgi:hypothetical protein
MTFSYLDDVKCWIFNKTRKPYILKLNTPLNTLSWIIVSSWAKFTVIIKFITVNPSRSVIGWLQLWHFWRHSYHLLWKKRSDNLLESINVAQSRQVSIPAYEVATTWLNKRCAEMRELARPRIIMRRGAEGSCSNPCWRQCVWSRQKYLVIRVLWRSIIRLGKNTHTVKANLI